MGCSELMIRVLAATSTFSVREWFIMSRKGTRAMLFLVGSGRCPGRWWKHRVFTLVSEFFGGNGTAKPCVKECFTRRNRYGMKFEKADDNFKVCYALLIRRFSEVS